jgi:hypothetical protein
MWLNNEDDAGLLKCIGYCDRIGEKGNERQQGPQQCLLSEEGAVSDGGLCCKTGNIHMLGCVRGMMVDGR